MAFEEEYCEACGSSSGHVPNGIHCAGTRATGSEILQSENGGAFAAMLRDVLLEQAAKARTDVCAFFEFVMTEENSKQSLTLASHQRVMMDFIMSHDRSVNMLPVGHSKTFCSAAITLFLLGQNPTLRGAVVSATQGQASKVVGMVRDYIETSERLKLVFPDLCKSMRKGDSWTQTEITVDRPPGIRDASLIALGVEGAVAGARLNWIIVDDILSHENTATQEQRHKVYEWFDSSLLSRLDPKNTKIIVTNTAWHPDDLVHRLEKLGWGTMRMDVLGNIQVKDDEARVLRLRKEGNSDPEWDSELLRPASKSRSEPYSRLVEHDPDSNNSVPLWPERFDLEWVERKKREHLPHRFNQLYMNICRDDASSMCQLEWIERCKLNARERGHFAMRSTPFISGNPLIFTGVDLAISPGEEHDDTALFTFEVLPGGYRLVLDIEAGQWNGPVIMNKIIAKQKQYNSVIRVENNGAQEYLLQFTRAKDISIPIMAHTTGRTKSHPEYGVPGVFLEVFNGAWLIPNDRHGFVHPHIQAWIDSMLYYQPSKHTPDILMANYFAREQAREWGALVDSAEGNAFEGSVGMSIMSR